MRNTFPLLAVAVIAGALAAGCAHTEQKLGRGISNTFEIVRMGEIRRSVEQTGLWDGPNAAYTTGVVRGLNRTLARTGIGLYEIVTCPFPPYDPVCTGYLTPSPVHPDNYTPDLVDDPVFSTDTTLGFSGGDIAPFVPGSRFSVFEVH